MLKKIKKGVNRQKRFGRFLNQNLKKDYQKDNIFIQVYNYIILHAIFKTNKNTWRAIPSTLINNFEKPPLPRDKNKNINHSE